MTHPTHLITEAEAPFFPSQPFVLTEEEIKGKKRLVIRGEFGRAGFKNKNRRVYPMEIMQREVGSLQEEIKEGGVYMSRDHPEDGKSRFSESAALIRQLTILEDGSEIGEAVILDTAAGRDIQAVIDAGGKVGVSQRGFGRTVEKDWEGESADVAEEDYRLKTFDFVIGPSVASSKVADVIREQEGEMKEMTLQEFQEKHPELYEQVRTAILEGLRPEIDDRVKAEMADYAKKYEEEHGVVESEEELNEAVAEALSEPYGLIAAILECFAASKLDKGMLEAATDAMRGDEDGSGNGQPAVPTAVSEQLEELAEGQKKTAEENRVLATKLHTKELQEAAATKCAGKPMGALILESLKERIQEKPETKLEEIDGLFAAEEARIKKIQGFKPVNTNAGRGVVAESEREGAELEVGSDELTESQQHQVACLG